MIKSNDKNYKRRFILFLCLFYSLVVSAQQDCPDGDYSNEMLQHGAENADIAGLADAVYNEPGRDIPEGYNRYDTFTRDNPVSGFHAETYESEDGKIVIAFRGSGSPVSDFNDWESNYESNVLNRITLQQVEASQYVRSVIEELGEGVDLTKITITGHSLGGNLAQFAAGIHDLRAVTFNSAHLNQSQHSFIGERGERNTDQIINFVHDDDPLHALNSATSVTHGTSHTTEPIMIDYDHDNDSGFRRGLERGLNFLSPFLGSGLRIQRKLDDHYMTPFRKHFECLREAYNAQRNLLNKQNSKTDDSPEFEEITNPFEE